MLTVYFYFWSQLAEYVPKRIEEIISLTWYANTQTRLTGIRFDIKPAQQRLKWTKASVLSSGIYRYPSPLARTKEGKARRRYIGVVAHFVRRVIPVDEKGANARPAGKGVANL